MKMSVATLVAVCLGLPAAAVSDGTLFHHHRAKRAAPEGTEASPKDSESKEPEKTEKSDEKPPPVQFTLKDKQENLTPGTIADGWAEGAKAEVKAETNTRTGLLTGTAAAHCRVRYQSVA